MVTQNNLSIRYFLCLMLMAIFISPLAPAAKPEPAYPDPQHLELSIEAKRTLRKELLHKMLEKYRQNQTFVTMRQYMLRKYVELDKSKTPEHPDVLITETLDKTRAVYEKVQPFVGNSFKRLYNPARIEESFNKYIWLKGPAFLILGIREEHKIALSFFYQPENESVKNEFLKDSIRYSYPEVLDIPENAYWFDQMNGVMEGIGYKAFNIDKYLPAKSPAGNVIVE